MRNFLILSVVCLLSFQTALLAQEPQKITLSPNVQSHYNPPAANGDFICNDAGTLNLGQFIGQSNDISLDTIYLCFRDSIFINHDGNGVFNGDPNPATPPGIVYAFYDCPPTVIGDDIFAIAADPCVKLDGSTPALPVVYGDQISGDAWFSNLGVIQTIYGGGAPTTLWFAPMTIDNFATLTYEGPPPGGPCVNVNTAERFAIVYLNEITTSGIVLGAPANPPCTGRFRVKGGYPELNTSAFYTIDISLQGNPSVKGFLLNPSKHNVTTFFSVPQAGTYVVTIEDGKSCGHTFTVDMSSCDPSQSVSLDLGEVNVPSGTNICLPMTVSNFNAVASFQMSISWDPTVLNFVGLQNPGTVPPIYSWPGNGILVGPSSIGLSWFDPSPVTTGITLPDGSNLLNVCFTAIGQDGDCSSVNFSNSPTAVEVADANFEPYGVSVSNGQVCIGLAPFDVVVDVIDTTCTGTADFEITATSGIAPYEVFVTGPMNYSGNISTSGGTFTAMNATNGQYQIILIDNNGFGDTLKRNITLNLPILGASLDFNQPTCNGLSNGAAEIVVTDGGNTVSNLDPRFTYMWLPAGLPSPSGPLQSPVGTGNFAVTVTDGLTGCTATASGTLGQPNIISAQTIVTKDAKCTGFTDGSISLTMSGGTPFVGNKYDFAWEFSPDGSPATPFASGNANPIAISNLSAGEYFVTVTDDNGCTYTNNFTVNFKKTISLDLANSLNPLCYGGSNGSLSVQLTTSPNQLNEAQNFQWNTVPFGPLPIGSTQTDGVLSTTLANIPTGSYQVFVLDTAGCFAVDTFSIQAPDSIKISTISTQNPSCTNPNSGAINLFVQGGIGPNYTYNWLPAGPNSGNLTGLAPGTYLVTVTDQAMCTKTKSIVLTIPMAPPITSVDSTSVNCGNDGCLKVNLPPGSPTVSYQWVNLTTQTNAGSTQQICGLNGGNYQVIITDNNQCTTTDTITLFQPDAMHFVDTIYTLPDCAGNFTGLLGVNVEGGSPNYSYDWSPAGVQNSAVLPSIGAGAYSVTVTDAGNCTLTGSFTLNNPPAIVATVNGISAASCDGICDGHATINAGYDDGSNGNFTFTWDDGNHSATRTNLCPGLHSVTVQDGNNCNVVVQVSILSPPAVTALPDSTYTLPVSCFGASDGAAYILGTGGNSGPYIYDWGTTIGQWNTNLSAGDYTVTITDNQGCTGVHVATVLEPSPINLIWDDLVLDPIDCAGDSNGIIGIVATGGNGQFPNDYFYEWSNGVSTTDIAENLPSGGYTVTVFDSEGCSAASTTYFLTDPPAVQGSLLPWEPLQCFGDQTTLYLDTIFGGSGGPYLFTVDDGVELTPDFPVGLDGGPHVVRFIDQYGCYVETTINVAEPSEIKVEFQEQIHEIKLGETTYQLDPIITGATIDTFYWNPTAFLSDPYSLHPYVSNIELQTYTLTVMDGNGCSGQGSITIDVDPDRNVYIPNIFHPGNSSGLNDRFQVYIGNGVRKVNFMRVFDRWGELVYVRENFVPNNNDFSEGWDGNFNGKKVNPGVFIYLIEVDFLDDQVLLYRGDVTVIR